MLFPDFDCRASFASTFLTSDCEIRNCRAIVDGLTPALKAARTAFCWPEVSRELSSGWRVFGAFPRLGRRRRRSVSAVTAASSAPSSASSRCFSAPTKSFGRRWRGCGAGLSRLRFPGEASRFAGAIENRSGVVSAERRGGIIKLCRRDRMAATPSTRYAAAIFLEAISLKLCPDGSSSGGSPRLILPSLHCHIGILWIGCSQTCRRRWRGRSRR